MIPIVLWGESSAPVVVESFESQGCSSCPPAERVMDMLQKTYGDSAILLTFHVDYWDSLGWKDPFSDLRYTQRQSDYAHALHQDSVYTPEMVIQGEVGFLGSDGRRARTEIESRLHHIQARPLHFKISQSKGNALQLTLADPFHQSAEKAVIVIVENTPDVHVLAGENKGEIMSGHYVVRDLRPMSSFQSNQSSAEILLNPIWNLNQTSIVVLVYDQNHLITAAQRTPIPKGVL